jgi:hypothetical protein
MPLERKSPAQPDWRLIELLTAFQRSSAKRSKMGAPPLRRVPRTSWISAWWAATARTCSPLSNRGKRDNVSTLSNDRLSGSNQAELLDTVVGSSHTTGIACGLAASMLRWRIPRRQKNLRMVDHAASRAARSASLSSVPRAEAALRRCFRRPCQDSSRCLVAEERHAGSRT